MNELITKPKTGDEFNKWLTFGSFQLAEIKDKNNLEQYFTKVILTATAAKTLLS